MSAGGRIATEKIPNSILVPAQAVFDKDGRSVVYVLHSSRFEERTVQVSRRGKTELLIAGGLRPGEKVALQDLSRENDPSRRNDPTQEKHPNP